MLESYLNYEENKTQQSREESVQEAFKVDKSPNRQEHADKSIFP